MLITLKFMHNIHNFFITLYNKSFLAFCQGFLAIIPSKNLHTLPHRPPFVPPRRPPPPPAHKKTAPNPAALLNPLFFYDFLSNRLPQSKPAGTPVLATLLLLHTFCQTDCPNQIPIAPLRFQGYCPCILYRHHTFSIAKYTLAITPNCYLALTLFFRIHYIFWLQTQVTLSPEREIYLPQ